MSPIVKKQSSQTKAQRERETAARLTNWAKWAAWSATPRGRNDHPFEPDEQDAQAVEDALLRMRRRRPHLFHYVKLAYLKRRHEATIAAELKAHPDTLKTYHTQVLVWIQQSAPMLVLPDSKC